MGSWRGEGGIDGRVAVTVERGERGQMRRESERPSSREEAGKAEL